MSQQINLFNPIFLREKKHFSAKTMGQGLGLIVVCTLLLFGYSRYQVWKLSQEATKVSAQLKQAQQQLASVTGAFVARKKDLQLEEQAKRAQQEVEAMQQAFARLRGEEFGTQKGYSDYLRAFSRQIVSGVWLTGFSIEGGGNAIGIQGAALTPELIPGYMNRLKREPVLQGKSFATFEIRQPKEVEQKPAEVVAGKKEKKESAPVSPTYVEFDLRSEGLEKAAEKGASAAAGVVKPSGNSSAPPSANLSSGAKGS